jgi:hypothetical protein
MRFSVVGQLLAAPPPKGELRAELERLAAREWQHPITGLPVRFGVSTVERWLHKARKENRDPVRVLTCTTRDCRGILSMPWLRRVPPSVDIRQDAPPQRAARTSRLPSPRRISPRTVSSGSG